MAHILCWIIFTSTFFITTDALQLSFQPPHGAFFTRNLYDAASGHREDPIVGRFPFFLHGNCPTEPNQWLDATHTTFHDQVPLSSISSAKNSTCGIAVRLVSTSVSRQRPFVDSVVYGDKHFMTVFHPTTVCINVYAIYKQRFVKSSCQLSLHGGVHTDSCLCRMVIPLSWWPINKSKGKKQPKTFVHFRYNVMNEEKECNGKSQVKYEQQLEEWDENTIFTTFLGRVELKSEDYSQYGTMPIDGQSPWSLSLKVPNIEFHPKMIFTVHVYFEYSSSLAKPNAPLYLFQVRSWVKPGLKIFAVENITDSDWMIRPEIIDEVVTTTCFFRNQMSLNESWSGAVYSLLLQVEDSINEDERTAEMEWSVRYVIDAAGTPDTTTPQPITVPTEQAGQVKGIGNFITKLAISKDKIYVLVPLSRKFELINTAVLSGEQVSQPLKVYSLTYGGQIADVTLQSSCAVLNGEHAVLKVTPSCAAVYLDGSEHRGGVNASVVAKFGNLYGSVSFTVWHPELPVEVWLSDPVLNAVRDETSNLDWKLPAKKKLPLTKGESKRRRKRKRAYKKRSYAEQLTCKQRYQEAEIRVYCSFRVDNLRTGRRSYLGMSRKLLFDVTDISYRHLKLTDRAIARIYKSDEGKIMVQGISEGSTEVRLVSPLWQIVNGASPMEVTSEPISLQQLVAFVSSGLNVSIDKSQTEPHSETRIQLLRTFTSKFQSGAISLTLVYSDERETQLVDLSSRDYVMNIWSREPNSIGVKNAHDHTKGMLALSDEGGGAMLDFELRSPEGCQNPEGTPLLSATAFVQISFPQRHIGIFSSRQDRSRSSERLYDPVDPNMHNEKVINEKGPAVKTVTVKYGPNSRSDKHPSQSTNKHSLSSIEITLIALVVLFVLVGSTMALNYVVLTGRSRPYKFQRLVPLLSRFSQNKDPDTTCQEWVWLSRDQIEAQNGSLGSSRYSRNSTVEAAEQAEHEQVVLRSAGSGSYGSAESGPRSVSYRGSEVSIFISRHPSMHVHEMCRAYGRRASSWNKPRPNRVRVTTNPMADSSSEQNISTLGAMSPHPDSYMTARSADVQWDSNSLGLDEIELRDYFSSLRESVA